MKSATNPAHKPGAKVNFKTVGGGISDERTGKVLAVWKSGRGNWIEIMETGTGKYFKTRPAYVTLFVKTPKD